MPWTTEQKVFCVQMYSKTESFKTVQSKFRRKFSFNYYPEKSQIYRWVKKFREQGTVLNQKSKGRNLSVRVQKNIDAVETSVARSPISIYGVI